MDVTVGIPTMNNESTIEQTLRQLDEQTRRPDRVLLVDASTDATPNVVARIASELDFTVDLYPQSDRGRGVGAARADIYERFDGDLLVCLDTDHAVNSDWLETHVRFHQENPEYGVLSNSSRDGFDQPVTDPLQSEFLGQSNCSLKPRVLDATQGWDPWMQRGEDWDFRIRLWTANTQSWAKNNIDAERFERDIASDTWQWFLTKVRLDPSSVTFLRKYGLWYLRFHPLHVAGDVLSLISILFILATPFGYLFSPLTVVGLIVPLVSSLAFVYYKGPRKRSSIFPKRRDISSFVVFYALGLSALRNLARVGGNEEWNYTGFDASMYR